MALLHGSLLTEHPGAVTYALEGTMTAKVQNATSIRVPLWRRLWLRIHEPRAVAVLHAVAYVAILVGGVWSLTHLPPTTTQDVGNVAMTLLVGMLAAGSAIGAVAVLPGWWWLERYGVMLIMGALGAYVLIVATTLTATLSDRMLGMSLIVALICHLIVRLVRIWERPYDPARRRS